MTENENYIKMVLALDPKFFENWELNDGDQVYLLKDIDDYTCSAEYGLYTVFDRLLAHEGVNDTENWHYVKWMLADGVIRPIPSQEQLIEIIIENCPRPNGEKIEQYYLLHEFYYFVKNTITEHFEKRSWCEMLLEYYVLRVYKKEWNGSEWL